MPPTRPAPVPETRPGRRRSFLAPASLGALALAVPPPAPGQTAVERFGEVERSAGLRTPRLTAEPEEAPTLFADETEDVGPQFLLLEPPHRRWWDLRADLQVIWTDNATLADSGRGSSDLTVLTLTAAAAPDPFELDGAGAASLAPEVGLRFQEFRYGVLGDRDKMIGGLAVDQNDFRAITPYAALTYRRGPWTLRAGLRHNTLRNRANGDHFYRETVPALTIARDLVRSPRHLLTASYVYDHRETDTDSDGLLPDGINDRDNHSLTLIYSRAVSRRWVAQPYVRLQRVDYRSGGRDDWIVAAGGTLAYFRGERWSARLTAGFEQLNSDGAGVADYERWDAGLGAAVRWRF